MGSADSNRTRAPGRPSAGTDQREALLDAATGLFAERGITGTRQNAIARRAGVTPALLHYYFGNREKLVGAVLEERLLPHVTPILAGLEQLDTHADPHAALVRLAASIIDAVSAAPWLPSLWVREVLVEGGQFREALLARVVLGGATKVRAMVEHGQAAGTINPGLDARLMMVSLVGLTIFPLASAPIWRRLPDSAAIDNATLVGHVCALLGQGLEPAHDQNA